MVNEMKIVINGKINRFIVSRLIFYSSLTIPVHHKRFKY